jgi:hypothetical protein
MSYVALAYFGMLPLGSLLISGLSTLTSAPTTLTCQGIMAIIIALIFARFLISERLQKKDKFLMQEDEEMVAGKN